VPHCVRAGTSGTAAAHHLHPPYAPTPFSPPPQYPDICWSGAPERFEDASKVFPDASLRFSGGAVLQLPPKRYLFIMGRGEYCLGVFDNGACPQTLGSQLAPSKGL
jgi:hypothetical protein